MRKEFWTAFNEEIVKVGVASMTMAKGKISPGARDTKPKLNTNDEMDAKDKLRKQLAKEKDGFIESKAQDKLMK